MLKSIKTLTRFALVGICMGAVTLLVMRQLDVKERESLASPVIPTSAKEMISKADLIFIGEVGSVVRYHAFSGYGKSGELLDGVTVDGKPHPNLPITDLELKVEKVLRDDGSVASNKPILLRMLGYATQEAKQESLNTDFPQSFTGDRHLFLLSRNPDGTYGFYYGPYSRLLVEGNSLQVSNSSRQLLSFDENKDAIGLEEFVQLIR